MARKIQERRGCRRPLPAMLSDCTLEGQGPAIMEEACPSPQAHERFRPKLGPPGYPLAKIGERRPHIVQQQIRIEMDHLAIERLDRARRDECWDMTLRTPEPMKEFATFVISTEWRGWGEESNEVDREIPIGRAQLAGHVNTLLGLPPPYIDRDRDSSAPDEPTQPRGSTQPMSPVVSTPPPSATKWSDTRPTVLAISPYAPTRPM